MSEVVQGSLPRWEQRYELGLLESEHKSPSAIAACGQLGYSSSYGYRLLKQQAKPYEVSRQERLKQAPKGMYLAVDLVPVTHEGCWIEGVDRVYSSSDKAPVWGHNLLSSGLVRYGEDPYPLSLEGFPTQNMATDLYLYRTPGQALLQSVKVVTDAGYNLAGVVFDNQFAGKAHLAQLHTQPIPTPFVARARLNQKIEFETQRLSIRELGQQYPPRKAHYYKRFGWYVKRLKIKLDGVGELDLIIVWLPQQEGFCTAPQS